MGAAYAGRSGAVQDMIWNRWFTAANVGVGRCAVLALCFALVACKPSSPEAGAAAEQAGAPSVPAPSAAAAPPPAPVAAPAVTSAQTDDAPAKSVTEEDDDFGPGLDDSYNVADLRSQYQACIDASDAVMPELQACQEEEFSFQQRRMRAALARIDAGPDGYFKDEVDNGQAEYMRHTDTNCGDKDEQGPVGEGLSCRINRYANRASALESLADMAQRANERNN